MSRFDDSSGDMSRFPSSVDADRLLGGRLSPDDLPDEAAALARLLAGLEPVATHDPFTERPVVADLAAEIRRNPAPASTPSLLRASGTRVPAKAGALAFVAVLATGTAAAAANGSLPAGVQRAVSDALSHVSISVPQPTPHRLQPVESQNGGTDEPRNGGSPGGATGPVGPRGVQHDDDLTPRGPKNATPGTGKSPDAGGKGDNGNHNGPPSSVPNGPKTTNPNGRNNGNGQNNVDNGRHNGDDQGQHNGDDNGKKQGADKGEKKGQTDDPPAVTPTTLKKDGKVKDKGKDESNAGGNGQGNGNANSHASPQVSGSDANP